MRTIVAWMLLCALAHGASQTISGPASVEDAYLHSGAPDNGYGGSTILKFQSDTKGIARPAYVVDSIGEGHTMDSAVWHIYVTTVNTAGTISTYQGFVTGGLELSYRINHLISVLVSVNCVVQIEEDIVTLANVFNAGVTFWL